MSYELKQNLANQANYGSKRDTSKIKYLVISVILSIRGFSFNTFE